MDLDLNPRGPSLPRPPFFSYSCSSCLISLLREEVVDDLTDEGKDSALKAEENSALTARARMNVLNMIKSIAVLSVCEDTYRRYVFQRFRLMKL